MCEEPEWYLALVLISCPCLAFPSARSFAPPIAYPVCCLKAWILAAGADGLLYLPFVISAGPSPPEVIKGIFPVYCLDLKKSQIPSRDSHLKKIMMNYDESGHGI